MNELTKKCIIRKNDPKKKRDALIRLLIKIGGGTLEAERASDRYAGAQAESENY